MQRLALLSFGTLLVCLFAGLGIAEGIGDPSIPSDAVAIVEDAPEGLGTITKVEFDRAFDQTAAAAQIPVPKPGEDRYDELKETALPEILNAIWIQAEAEEMGISITQEEVAKELDSLKNRSFKTEKQYEEFLEEGHFTKADIDQRVRTQMAGEKIREKLGEGDFAPSDSEVEDYYEAAKPTEYTTQESRDIRFIVNKDEAKVEMAKAALETDNSSESWEELAKKYSSDPSTKYNGGQQSGISEDGVEEPLAANVFAAEKGEIEGPIDDSRGALVFEVVRITPEESRSLEEVDEQISSRLTEQAKEAVFTRFILDYGSRWRAHTFCASGYVTESCANFKRDVRPAGASPACYEENPKSPPEGCPAPVQQAKPALPGSVTVLRPDGEQWAQRPRPAGLEADPSSPTLP